MPRVLSEADVVEFRERLCDAAERLFADKGPEAVTMRQLAAELGVSPMTPYRYFKDKDDILAAVRTIGFDRFAETLEAAYAKADARRVIERLGGRSVRASNGIEALDILRIAAAPGGTPFDCALFDVRMPELDGLSAIRQWREFELANNKAPLPALALTANAFREDREACLAAGFDGFLAKPLDREIFIRTVEGLLPKARRVA